MPAPFRVLITDYMWHSLEIEKTILEEVGAELIVAETGDEVELLTLASAANVILTCWKPVTSKVLDVAKRCLAVGRYGIGLDNIAVDHATELGILVTNIPDYCLDEVSDHTLALILACARNIARFTRETHHGIWDLSKGSSMRRLRGKTLGLVGYGKIARKLTPKALALGFKVIAYDILFSSTEEIQPSVIATHDLEYLLRAADYISLHVPLTEKTHFLIDAHAFKLMKPTAFLINTSRGAIIDETDLYQALTEGWIAGAAIDVLVQEPPDKSYPLFSCDNLIATPHAAFYSIEAIEELEQRAALQAVEVLRGRIPPNIVNPIVMGRDNFRLRKLEQLI